MAGSSFTVDDLRNNAEITDAELDAAAGGYVVRVGLSEPL